MALTSLVASNSRAADDRDKYRLVWIRGANAGECAEQSIIERQVQSRLERDPFEPDAERLIHVLVSSEGGSWHVQLVVRDNAGNSLGQRVLDVNADNCDEVATAVSLAIALAIDPNASLQPPPLVATGADSATAAIEPTWNLHATSHDHTGSGTSLSANNSAKEKLERLHRHVAEQHCRDTEAPATVRESNRNPYQYELSLRAVGASGILPRFAPGTAVAGSFGRDGVRLMMGLTYLPESTSDARFSYGFTAASGGVCSDVVHLRLLATTVCGEIDVGAIHSVVHELEPVHPGDRAAAALGLGPKLGWRAWAPLFFELGISAWVGLVRPKFTLVNADSTRTTVFQSRAISGIGFAGVGVTMP